MTDQVDELDIVCIGGGLSAANVANSLSKGSEKLTVIMANEFLEWSLAATYFLVKPEDYMQFVSPNKSTFQIPGVDYIYEVVSQVKPEEKLIILSSGRRLKYKVLIVSTGFKLPLINCDVGISLKERFDTVKEWGAHIASAKTIVINGAGTVGFELAGDIKLNFPSTRVVVLSRSGKILNPAYPDDVLSRIKSEIDRVGIEVVKGTVDESMTSPTKVAGTLALSNSDIASLDYDIYLPAYAQGANTDFLPDSILEDGRFRNVATNEFLQSTVHPEVFAIGCNTSGEGFISTLLQKQAQDVATNAIQLLRNEPLIPHKILADAAGLNWAARPPFFKMGYGPGGFLMFDNLKSSIMSCLQCVGFPFCPAPCCYPCCGWFQGAFACGWCCFGRPEGQSTMNCFLAAFGIGGVKQMPKSHFLSGMGEELKGGLMERA